MTDLSIIIVNWNTQDLLRDCLNSIYHQTMGIKFEVIVVDNGSADQSTQVVNKEFPKVVLIKNKENLGFAKANNQGIKRAKGRYLFLLNSDTVLKDNSLVKLIEFADKHPRLAILGCKLLNKDGSNQPSTAPFFTPINLLIWLFTGDKFLFSSPSKPKQVDWVMGAAFMIKREVADKVGLLDENFFMYMEEAEWCYRVKKAGWEVWFYPQAEIYHLVRGSSPEGKQKAVLGIYKGLIYFYQKHFAPQELSVLKFLLRTKAGAAWAFGMATGNHYLRETYEKAFKMVK